MESINVSEHNRFWRIEQQVDSLKVKTDQLERAIIKLETWAARKQSEDIAKLAADAGLKDQKEVEPP